MFTSDISSNNKDACQTQLKMKWEKNKYSSLLFNGPLWAYSWMGLCLF